MYSHCLSSRTLLASPRSRHSLTLEQSLVTNTSTKTRSRNSRSFPHYLNVSSDSIEASGDVQPVEETELENVKQIMRGVCEGEAISSVEICDAFRYLEKNKIKYDDLAESLAGGPDGKYWNLQFVARKNSMKKGNSGGYRFPLTAIQHLDGNKISNGVYLNHVASLSFYGMSKFQKNTLAFTFDKIRIQLGPANFTFPVKGGSSAEGLFVFFYVDEDFFVARGKTGGTALFKRVPPSWVLERGGG